MLLLFPLRIVLDRMERVSAATFTFFLEAFAFSRMYMLCAVKGDVAIGVDGWIDIAGTMAPTFYEEDIFCHCVLLFDYDFGISVGKFKAES